MEVFRAKSASLNFQKFDKELTSSDMKLLIVQHWQNTESVEGWLLSTIYMTQQERFSNAIDKRDTRTPTNLLENEDLEAWKIKKVYLDLELISSCTHSMLI